MIRFLVFIMGFTLWLQGVQGQVDTVSVLLNFDEGSSLVDLTIKENQSSLDALEALLEEDTLKQISKIVVNTNISTQREGEQGWSLSQRRAHNIKSCLVARLPVSEGQVFCNVGGVDKRKYLALIKAYDVPFKDEVVELATCERVDNERLKDLREGLPYHYIREHIFPFLRSANVVTIIFRREIESPLQCSSQPFCTSERWCEPPINRLECGLMPEHIPQNYEQVTSVSEPEVSVKPLFALKTNLLFDLATLINLEIEIPIKQRWSIAAEIICPWWSNQADDLTFQTRAGHLALNYWLGDRSQRQVLTGWHLGLIGGYGLYDFQIYDTDGVQGRFFDVGFSCGYTHSLGNSPLRFEYQLGVGYLNTTYEKYRDVDQTKYGDIKVVDYPWEKKRRHWVGPIQARVSLVWMINSVKKGGQK